LALEEGKGCDECRNNEGRLVCSDLGKGEGPVKVIFWVGGAGGWVDEDDEDSDSLSE